MSIDISHWYGADLQTGPTGDLAVVSGDPYTQQRVVRRLMTAAGGYIQQLAYGASLGTYVGLPAAAAKVRGVILRQMRKEATVAQQPPPTVAATQDVLGNITATINYSDAVTQSAVTVTLPLSG